jgi:adenylate kinase family enzyme
MRKVIVIGSGGSGKSTFSRRLGAKLGLPVVHLDKLFWRPNWVETPKDEWSEIVRSELDKDFWIMDGNFGGTRELRMQACDTIIFLDIPRRVCVYRILKRAAVYHGGTRPDMTEGCNERFDLKFIVWVWNYPNRSKKRIIGSLRRFADKTIVVLRSTTEVEKFLKDL